MSVFCNLLNTGLSIFFLTIEYETPSENSTRYVTVANKRNWHGRSVVSTTFGIT